MLVLVCGLIKTGSTVSLPKVEAKCIGKNNVLAYEVKFVDYSVSVNVYNIHSIDVSKQS